MKSADTLEIKIVIDIVVGQLLVKSYNVKLFDKYLLFWFGSMIDYILHLHNKKFYNIYLCCFCQNYNLNIIFMAS